MKQFYSAGTVETPVIAAILGNCSTATKMGAAQPAKALKITRKILELQNSGDADGDRYGTRYDEPPAPAIEIEDGTGQQRRRSA